MRAEKNWSEVDSAGPGRGSARFHLLWVGISILGATTLWTLDRLGTAADERVLSARSVERLAAEIRFHDEVLTGTALLAAASGRRDLEERFDRHVELLDQVLIATERAVPEASEILASLGAVNARLVTIETEVFRLVREGEEERARALIEGPAYLEDKERYAEAMVAIDRAAIDHAEALRAKGGSLLGQTTWAVTIVFLLVIGLVLMVARRDRAAERIRAERAHAHEEVAISEARSELQYRILTNLNHQLRTPLNGLLGLLGVMHRATRDDEHLAGLLRHAERQAQLLLEDFQNLLFYAEIVHGDLALVDKEASLSTLARRLRESASSTAAAEVSCEILLDGDLDWGFTADLDRILLALEKILKNALQAAPQGQVRVDLSIAPLPEGRGQLTCAIEDDGPGFPEGEIERLLSAFEVGITDRQRGERQDGTGLGLPIAAAIAESFGGHLLLENRAEGGARVVFFVPVTLMDVVPAVREDGGGGPGEGASSGAAGLELLEERKPRVLVAEDNRVNRMVIARQLRALGCLAEVVPDGSHVLPSLQEGAFDLVFMDVQMPVMDGLEATRHLRAQADTGIAGVPVIALTANATEADRRICLDAGMNEHLSKPATAEMLGEAIARHLEPAQPAP